ncbi:DUF2461 domain-containing protein [Microcella daejeonensis]|uniref:DUF2461 domain-containing protein n=1 Tax=Microcella daejeonensis TaxID=2994971 RepID=A0A9E8S991_9MICO|nr:DUF2461 domain-containing protein [Microcella daejeonensis]WAB82103.1 DUF2461 domain-containing protein [Microcella daejeonensis]
MSDSPVLVPFTHEATTYLTGIAADNSKAYVEEHREVYDRAIRRPMEALLAEAERRYGPGKIMRQNRDVRFSADKSPYRVDASMMAGEVGTVYVNLDAERIEVGGGLYGPSKDQLERARGLIVDDAAAAEELESIVSALESQGFELAGPSLKTAPRGIDPAHPAIRLLRLQHYAALRRLPVEAPPSEVLAVWSATEPLIEWVATRVGPATTSRGH